MTDIDELWEEFAKEFWSKQCCPYPCINFQPESGIYLEGAEAFYKFVKNKKEKKEK